MMEWPQLTKPEAKYFTSTEACSCPDWRFRGRQRPCKHVEALRQAVAVIAATNAKWATKGGDDETDTNAIH